MGRLLIIFLDKGLDIFISPLSTWGGPIMGGWIAGYWAYASGMPGVDVFLRAWQGALYGFATIIGLIVLNLALRKASLWWQMKAFDELSDFRSQTIDRFWPVTRTYNSVPVCRREYEQFKKEVATRLRYWFSNSYANEYLRIGILHRSKNYFIPPSVPQQDHADYMVMHDIIKRDTEWINQEISRFNTRYISKTML